MVVDKSMISTIVTLPRTQIQYLSISYLLACLSRWLSFSSGESPAGQTLFSKSLVETHLNSPQKPPKPMENQKSPVFFLNNLHHHHIYHMDFRPTSKHESGKLWEKPMGVALASGRSERRVLRSCEAKPSSPDFRKQLGARWTVFFFESTVYYYPPGN